MQITDDEIKRVEKLFFPKGGSFADQKNERINFIKCIDKSIHLQACPGSGKTTALLAKIYLLSEKMPFENNRGICVLTHTNVAIDLIKKQLGNKADKLFTHPNFFGTIQSFVDRFLAIPAYVICFGKRPNYIDTEMQKERMNKTQYLAKVKKDFFKRLKSYNYANDIFGYYTFIKDSDSIKIINSIDRKEINFKKPRSKNDWNDDEKTGIKVAAAKLKIKVLKEDGVLSYEDAYDFAQFYLKQYPQLCKYFSSRFKYVFIDEAQDTSSIQKEIIEKCFNDNVIIQWIGDSNQAIMNNNEEESAWKSEKNDRYEVMHLTDSKRVSQPIADIIKNVATKKYNNLCGQNSINLKPVIILFDENTKANVIQKFAELVVSKKSIYNNEEKSLYEISEITRNPIKAIGWVGKPKNNGLSIQSYFPDFFKRSSIRKKQYFPNLYTMIHLSKKESLKVFADRFYSCIVESLYISDIKDNNSKKFTKSSFTNHIKLGNDELFIKMNKIIYKTFKEIINNNFNDVKFDNVSHDLITYLTNDLKFQINDDSKKYLTEKEIKEYTYQQIENENYYSTQLDEKEIKIQIDTVHAVKGETHTATLYLETKYFKNSIKYFQEELITKNDTNAKGKNLYALKIAHVAFSRPTHLLCIAINKADITNNQLDGNIFEVIDLTN